MSSRAAQGQALTHTLLLCLLWAYACAENILWCGGVTDTTANFRVESSSAIADYFVLHTSPSYPSDRSAAVLSIPIQAGVTAVDMAPLPDNLAPMTTYYYGVESDWSNTGRYAKFTTMPSSNTAANFSFAFASCARTGSDSPVFTEVKRLQDEADSGPSPHLFFLHLGDLFYEDIGEDDIQMYRAAYKAVWDSPTQSALYRNKALVYMWDDHDFGENDSNMQSPSRAAAMKSYQMFVPHHAFADPSASTSSFDVPLYHAYTVGRVRFIVLDLRSMSEPAMTQDSQHWDTYSTHPTMLGADQKAWLGTELASHSSYGMVVLVMTKPWTGEVDNEDCCKWLSYPDERREVAEMIKSNGVDNLVAVSGDAHMLAYDDGSNTDFTVDGGAGFPILQSAPLEQTSSFKGGPYSHGCYAPEVTPLSWLKRIISLGYWQPDTSQFSVMEVTDTGGPLLTANICFKVQGYRLNEDTSVAEKIAGATLEKCTGTAPSGEAGIMKPAGSSSPGTGQCPEQAIAESNKAWGFVLVGLVMASITLCCGLTCQYMACKRVCCKDCRKKKGKARV